MSLHRTLSAFFVLSLAGCNQEERAGLETAAAKTLITDEDENKIGLQVKGDLEGKQNVRYLDDAEVNNYVAGVANKVLAFARRDRPGVSWQVQVIEDPGTVNAFATPGGFLYVYTGLVQAADNEAELAGVLGHEAGHVVARHSARQMVDTYGLQAVASLALGQNPGLLGQIGSGIAEKGLLLAHSRSDEDEADEYGTRYASAAGYDPHGLATFFEKLKKMEGRSPGVLVYLSDHPATPDRIDHVNRLIAEKGLGGSDRGADRLAPIKRRLAARPAPPKGAPGGGAPGGGTPSGGTAPKGSPPAGAPPNG